MYGHRTHVPPPRSPSPALPAPAPERSSPVRRGPSAYQVRRCPGAAPPRTCAQVLVPLAGANGVAITCASAADVRAEAAVGWVWLRAGLDV